MGNLNIFLDTDFARFTQLKKGWICGIVAVGNYNHWMEFCNMRGAEEK